MESLGEKRKRMKAQREQATRLITELTALGYATGTVRGFTAEVLLNRVIITRFTSVTEVLGKLQWLSLMSDN